MGGSEEEFAKKFYGIANSFLKVQAIFHLRSRLGSRVLTQRASVSASAWHSKFNVDGEYQFREIAEYTVTILLSIMPDPLVQTIHRDPALL